MKKEMTLSAFTGRASRFTGSRSSLCLALCLSCARSLPVMWLSRCYSRLLGEAVGPLRTLRLLHVQLAFLLLVLPVPFLFAVRVFFLLWFGLALLQCRGSSCR